MSKIRKIKFIDHPILKNLELDFCDANGNAVDTVILAGENGTGKSTLLNCLYSLITGSMNFEAVLEIENHGSIETLTYFERKQHPGLLGFYVYDSNGHELFPRGSEFEKMTGFSAIFSDVDINFNSGGISNVTSMVLDGDAQSRKSDTDFPKRIKQLLIDIQAMDDADSARICRENPTKSFSELDIPQRMDRFTSAFTKIFDQLQYSRIENRQGKKCILFTKNGQDVAIDELSSGEKQIVYRGCYLLKDANAMNGAYVFIDEPEISLHPRWQMKIMDYYKSIFTNSFGQQTSQIFSVTHSPFIIHNEARKNDKVIVLTRNDAGNIAVATKPEYFKCDSVEAIQDAFFIPGFAAEQSTVYVEGRTDVKYFERAVKVYGLSLPFHFKWVGHLDQNRQEVNTGEKSVDAAYQFLVSQNPPVKHFCLKDCDTKRQTKSQSNVTILSIPKYENAKGIRKGIENALVLDTIDITPYYIPKMIIGDYGEEKIIPEFQKMDCCEAICAMSDDVLQNVFVHLKEMIDTLISLYSEE